MRRESLGFWDSENMYFIGWIFNENVSTVLFLSQA